MSFANECDRLLFRREGGAVDRAHTIPKIGPYPVAQHSFNMVQILLVLHPRPSKALIIACLQHDLHERVTGDVPSPTKRFLPDLARIEHEAQEEFELSVDLSDDDNRWLKSVDVLELFLWTQDQLAFGNRHVENVVSSCEAWFARHREWIPAPIIRVLATFKWRRTNPRDERDA